MNNETKKEWFLDRYCGQQFAAFVEDGKLKEFTSEKEPLGVAVGNIYKGRVTNVLSGMNAAFINCGLERNCYLSMEETYTDYTKYDGTMVETNNKIPDLKVGDEVIVQITKPPRGTKGAKVTTHLSFVGKYIIYLPNTNFVGISRKITDPLIRERLLSFADVLRARETEGYIVRTQAPFASKKQLETEAVYLEKLYVEMMNAAKTAPVGSVLYEDEDLPIRVMRDCYGDEVTAFHIGDQDLYDRLIRLVKLRQDIPEEKLVFYQGERSMMKEYGISPLVYAAATSTVALPNGGSIVIEPTEAMTVIDVNTGKYTGESSREETVFATNLEAAKEIAAQVRLRNVGGIVVVDFIDMAEEAHREAVTEALRSHLALDTAKCNVLPMSELCLTQFTRRRVGNEVLAYLVKPCAHCAGVGRVPEDIFVITRIRAAILDCFADGFSTAVVELNEQTMRKIFDEKMFATEAKNRWKNKNIYFIPHKTYKEECFSVRGDHTEKPELPENAQSLK